MSNPSYSAPFLGKNHQQAFTAVTLVMLVGEHRRCAEIFVDTVCCSGIKLYMKCVALVYTGSKKIMERVDQGHLISMVMAALRP